MAAWTHWLPFLLLLLASVVLSCPGCLWRKFWMLQLLFNRPHLTTAPWARNSAVKQVDFHISCINFLTTVLYRILNSNGKTWRYTLFQNLSHYCTKNIQLQHNSVSPFYFKWITKAFCVFSESSLNGRFKICKTQFLSRDTSHKLNDQANLTN